MYGPPQSCKRKKKNARILKTLIAARTAQPRLRRTNSQRVRTACTDQVGPVRVDRWGGAVRIPQRPPAIHVRKILRKTGTPRLSCALVETTLGDRTSGVLGKES